MSVEVEGTINAEALPAEITRQPSTTSQNPINSRTAEQLQIEEPGSTEDDTVYPSGTKLWLAVISFAITNFVSSTDVTVVAVAVPSLTNEFHTINDIGWYNAAYMMVIGATGFFFGKVYTLFNIKRTYLLSLVIFWFGSVICTFATSSAMFIAGRAILGLGCSCEAAGFVTLFSTLFPKHKRPRWIGNIFFVGSAGLVSGPLIGGLLIQRFGWRACFGINIPLYGLCAILAAYGVPSGSYLPNENLPLKEKLKLLDLTGSLVFAPALTCLLLALAWGGSTYGWSDPRIIALFVVTAVLFGVFGVLQWRLGEKASLPPRIVKQRSILAGAFFSACCNGALNITENYIAIYFQGVRGYNPAQSALLGIPMIVGLMASALISGWGSTWIGYYNPFLIITSVLAPIASGVLTTISLESQIAMAAGLLGLLGFAIGMGLSVPSMVVTSILEPSEVSLGAAVVHFGGSMGSAIWSAVAATLFQGRLEAEVSQYAPGTNVTNLEHAGLSEIRQIIGEDRLTAVLTGYDVAVVQTLYIPVALTALTIVGTVFTEWRSIKKKRD